MLWTSEKDAALELWSTHFHFVLVSALNFLLWHWLMSGSRHQSQGESRVIRVTWLWWWLPLRLSKRQSPLPTTVLLRTTLTQMIKLHYYMLPPGSNHLLYKMYLLPFPGHNNFLGLEENWDLRVFLQRQCSLIQNFLCHYCFLTDYTTSIKKQYNTSQRTVNKYSKQSERSVAICAESKWSFEKR